MAVPYVFWSTVLPVLLGLIRGVGGHGGGGLACTSVCVTSKRTRRLIASKC